MKLALVQAWMGTKLSHWKTSAKGIRSCHSVKPTNLGWPYWLNFWKGMGPWDWVSCFRQGMKLQWRTAAALGEGHPVSQYADSHSLENGQLWWMDGCFPNWDVYLEPKDPPLRHMSRRMATLIHSDMPLQGAMLALGPPATMARMLILFEQRHGWGAIGGRRRWKGHGKCANNGGLFLE